MKNKFFSPVTSLQPPTPHPTDEPTVQAASKKRFGRKLYITIAAVAAIAVILAAAVLFVPQTNADVISLGVHYSAGEKLTYDVTSSYSTSTQGGNSSSNISSESTVSVEVVNFDGDTYTLNYTVLTSSAGYSFSTSHLLEVKSTDMVNLLTLLPIALQQYITNTNDTTPVETAIFNQTQATVGDTWQVPITEGTSSAPAAEITVTFKAIQELTVPAGTFKVFRIDFSQTPAQQSQSSLANLNYNVSGQSYLEYGTCKQIQSSLQLNVTGLGIGDINEVISFTSSLTKDTKP